MEASNRLAPVVRRHVVTLCLFFLLATSCRGDEDERKPNCGVYLAPSSIPGAGLGMYAGDKHYKEEETVTLGDAVIPIIEYHWNNAGGPYENASFLWDEYIWNGPVFPGMDQEGEDPGLISGASPGVGAAANSYISLVNVEDTWLKMGRAVGPDSPGLGATTIYFGREFYATKEIPPGGEIFIDYGSDYFISRVHTYGYLPLPNNLKGTDRMLKKYLIVKNRVEKKAHTVLATDLWKDCYDTARSFAPIWGSTSRLMNGLPTDEGKIETILNEGGAGQQHYNRSRADLSWLEEHGQCMDNIKVGNSTNPDAGRGAFANRFIPKGGLVAPAPLIHIPDYNALKVFLPKDSETAGNIVPDRDGPFSFQLLLNYCFGHEESTLLLCPYGLLTAFINHSHEQPNTKIQWSGDMRNPEWRLQPIDYWANTYHAGLQIDFVALRDIEEDEEIFIDYGAAWEAAWQEHVKKFVPRKNYIPAFELNEMENIDYRTVADVEYKVDNVVLYCRAWYIRQFVDGNEDCECRILKKLGNDRYLVQLTQASYDQVERYMEVIPGSILWNVPSDAFYFVDLPYTRDHYDFQSFRHAMMMPDELFPEVWMNLQEYNQMY